MAEFEIDTLFDQPGKDSYRLRDDVAEFITEHLKSTPHGVPA
ncbi:MAG: hypothetical protein BMS9Abin08_0358 [Gammaproteobacteria bacterium]|nr:MAG: hypothetical protein BMS9Abin08_0358 [Gammaproteobacteria bacterium]